MVAANAAFGLMSIATTLVAPARAAASDRMPLPVPTSATRLPVRSSSPMKPAAGPAPAAGFAGGMGLADEPREVLAGGEHFRGEPRRRQGQTEARHVRDRGPRVLQEQMIGPEMDERADEPPQQAMTRFR